MSDNASAADPAAQTAPSAAAGQSAAFSDSMRQSGVRADLAGAAAEWLSASEHDLTAPATHGYDLSEFQFTAEDLPEVNALANALKKEGYTQADLASLHKWWTSQPAIVARDVQARRDVEALDQQHRAEVEGVLRAEWGDEYAHTLRLINRYLNGLPAKEREAIEGKVLADGRRGLNDPDTLRDLAQKARGGAAPSGEALAREIADIERQMRENRTAYNKDAKMQARLRDLYRARNG